MPAVQDLPAAALDTSALLNALTALREGDFSVRLPADWTGVAGKVADAFNDVVELNERMAGELARLSRVVGKEGKLTPAARARRRDRLLARVGRLGQRPDRRPRPPDQRDGPRDRRRGPGRPVADDGPGDRRPPAAGRVPPHRQDHQHDGGSARLVRVGSDARGPRGGHRRQARRPGQGEGRGRHLEGPHRLA